MAHGLLFVICGGKKVDVTDCWLRFIPTLVLTFSEFFVQLLFTPFKPFLLREKRVPPTLVVIKRLRFQSPFFTLI